MSERIDGGADAPDPSANDAGSGVSPEPTPATAQPTVEQVLARAGRRRGRLSLQEAAAVVRQERESRS